MLLLPEGWLVVLGAACFLGCCQLPGSCAQCRPALLPPTPLQPICRAGRAAAAGQGGTCGSGASGSGGGAGRP